MSPRKDAPYNPEGMSEVGNVALVAYKLSEMTRKIDDVSSTMIRRFDDISSSSARLEEKLDKRVRDMELRFNDLDDRYLKRTNFEPYRSNLLKIAMAIILAVLGAALAFFLKK